MYFKRFHAWAEFYAAAYAWPWCQAQIPLSPVILQDLKILSSEYAGKIIPSHWSCEGVNLPLNCKLSPFNPLSSYQISSSCSVGFQQTPTAKPDALFLKHLRMKSTSTCCLSVRLPVTSRPCDLNQIQSHTWGTGTIKSTNRRMPGCSAQSAPVWQSVPLVISASWLGSLNINPPSSRSCSSFAKAVAALFTYRLVMHHCLLYSHVLLFKFKLFALN